MSVWFHEQHGCFSVVAPALQFSLAIMHCWPVRSVFWPFGWTIVVVAEEGLGTGRSRRQPKNQEGEKKKKKQLTCSASFSIRRGPWL